MTEHPAARALTSHERMAQRPWDASYQDGPAPWDIGEPQPAIAELAAQGGFSGSVLDAGCGTGEHALLIAGQGLSVLGVDVAETALAMARQKAENRRIAAEFRYADAFELHALERRFDSVLDVGLFHTCDDDERARYVNSLASVTEPGANFYVLAFRDEGENQGPHPVSEKDIRDAFTPAAGWTVKHLQKTKIMTRFHDQNGGPAWLATIRRVSQK